MVKVVTAYNNFARGQADHDMMGRFDLPLYNSSADKIANFFTNFKGNAIYRSGFEDMLGEAFQDCHMHEFKFRDDQNYIMVFYNTKVRFLSYDAGGNFGWVLSGGVPIEVTTPYTLAESKELQFTQNSDVVVITHQSHAPRELKRISATSFTIGLKTLTGIVLPASEWPKACRFYKGRLYFANTVSKPTTVWGSEGGNYNNYAPAGTATDTSPLQFTLSDIAQPIEWLFNGDNSLIAGSSQGIVAINGGGIGSAIKADTIEANLTSAEGSSLSSPFTKDGLIFYVGKDDRNIYFFSYDLLTESFKAKDANLISYEITKGGITKVRHKKDKNDLIYAIRGDGALVTLNFKEDENIIGWHEQTTNGEFKDQVVITDNDGNPQLFVLALRGGSYYIERLADYVEFSKRVDFFSGKTGEAKALDNEAYNRKVAEELLGCVYLDNSLKVSNLQEGNTITYFAGSGSAFSSSFSFAFGSGVSGSISAASPIFSAGDVGKHISYKTETGYESGRFEIIGYTSTTAVDVKVLQEPTSDTYDNWYLSFGTLSGLTRYIGSEIGIVTDGGFLDSVEITEDSLDLGSQTLYAVVGHTYRGLIKSFSLGFQVQAENTQTTTKTILRAGIRCVTSAGGEFGSSQYRTEPVQKLTQSDLNYLPPLPIDGTNYVDYTDDHEFDKFFYLIQDAPLPFSVTAVMIDASYTFTR